tara:strand:- start:80 stop:757 length:678 start_codon:yes stop_codon:yes gene_type:complete
MLSFPTDFKYIRIMKRFFVQVIIPILILISVGIAIILAIGDDDVRTTTDTNIDTWIDNKQKFVEWAYNEGYDTIGILKQDIDIIIIFDFLKWETSFYSETKLEEFRSFNREEQLEKSGLNVDDLKSLDGNLNLKPGDGISSGYNRTSDLRYTFYSAKLCSFLSKTIGKGYDNSDLIKIEEYLKKYYKSNDIQYWEINEYHSSYILYNNVDLWLLIDRLLNNLYED